MFSEFQLIDLENESESRVIRYKPTIRMQKRRIGDFDSSWRTVREEMIAIREETIAKKSLGSSWSLCFVCRSNSIILGVSQFRFEGA